MSSPVETVPSTNASSTVAKVSRTVYHRLYRLRTRAAESSEQAAARHKAERERKTRQRERDKIYLRAAQAAEQQVAEASAAEASTHGFALPTAVAQARFYQEKAARILAAKEQALHRRRLRYSLRKQAGKTNPLSEGASDRRRELCRLRVRKLRAKRHAAEATQDEDGATQGETIQCEAASEQPCGSAGTFFYATQRPFARPSHLMIHWIVL